MPPVVCTIEIGNTLAKFALFSREADGLPQPVSEIDRRDPAEGPPWELLLAALWSGGLTHILLSGSRPALVSEWATAIRARLDQLPVKTSQPNLTVINHHSQIGVPIDLAAPDRVGLDRLLSARAALALPNPTKTARLIISTGTATTIDLVTAEGHFAGGAILPGIDLGGRALHQQTELLPLVTLSGMTTEPDLLGRDTQSAISSGLFWGQIGAICEIAQRLAGQHDIASPCLLTGGAAPRLAASLAKTLAGQFDLQHIPHLTLSGLALCIDTTTRAD